MFIEKRVICAIESQIEMMIDAYSDTNIIADHLSYYNLDWDAECVTVGYKNMAFPIDLGEDISCVPIGEIELGQLFKPMSAKRAEYLTRHTDYVFRKDGTVIAYMEYDCITFKKNT